MQKIGLMLLASLVAGLMVLVSAVGCASPAATQAPSKTSAPAAPAPAPAAKPPASTSPAAAAVPSAAPKPGETLPQMLKFGCYELGATGYAIAGGLFPEIARQTGMTVRLVPGGTDIARMILLRGRDTDLLLMTEGTGCFAGLGIGGAFDAPEWGPQRLQLVYRGHDILGASLLVRGDSGIKEIKDLKGKRVARVPGSPSTTDLIRAYMAFGGLTYADVTPVDYASYQAALTGVQDGSCDAVNSAAASPASVELAASPHKARLLQTPYKTDEDKKGWDRVRAIAPYLFPGEVPPEIIHLSQPDLNYMVSPAYPYAIYAYPWADQYLVYRVAKALWDGYPGFKGAHANLALWDPKSVNTIDYLHWVSSPPSPGFVRLLKEKGVWTAEYDKWQKSRQDRQDASAKLWEQAQKLATDKKIKIPSKEWSAFWQEYVRTELTKAGLW